MKKRKPEIVGSRVVKTGISKTGIVKPEIVRPGIIKDPKARGEWVESVFMARASEHGLAVSKPWGESN
ncbi:MAG: hypothetical protein WA604_17770, partial [Candidatus Sulfotelmatobacter sp.]